MSEAGHLLRCPCQGSAHKKAPPERGFFNGAI